MNGFQNGKARNLEKPVPGCLGRMVNLFDLSTGVAGNRLLTDKPHRDGSSLSRRQPDVTSTSPISYPIEDKVIVSDPRWNSPTRKSNGTPMKMLIAQEMSKEVESLHNHPNVVAKLMGLDASPHQLSDSNARRSRWRGHSRSVSGNSLTAWQQERGYDIQVQHGIHLCPEQNECRDIYEIWQQSQKGSYGRDKSPHKGRSNENVNEKNMDLVRQKFMEAKRLATDEKLRQSKQFQDALEVLTSNKDLFLKFLQEPNSLLSQHLNDLQTIPPPTETKRITVLRPSKIVDSNKFAGLGKKDEKQTKKTLYTGEVVGWDKSNPGLSPPTSWRVDNNQPTRIVVLKPSSGKPEDIKAVVSPPCSSPRILANEEYYVESVDNEEQDSPEVAKENTMQMHENLSGHRRDETLLSSAFSNGYIGDESSFNKSENEYQMGNLSDSEVMSPTSRHSWDYINRFESPYSSFSRAPYSPESSVCREAKKRLSERWAMMASNGSCLDQKHTRRSSSTLGEMLALSDIKSSVGSHEVGISKEQEPRASTLCKSSDLNKDENFVDSPRNLLRSKSVPDSSTGFGERLNIEVLEPEVGKTDVSKEIEMKNQTTKSSLRGKVSSLFLSRTKISTKEKCSTSQSKDESPRSAGTHMQSHGETGEISSQCAKVTKIQEGLSPHLHGSFIKTASPDLISMGHAWGVTSSEGSLSMTKPACPGNTGENQEQPSPISVLEAPFEGNENAAADSSCDIKPEAHGAKLLVHPNKSSLIDKSPPIGSTRTLSWDDSCAEAATAHQPKTPVSHGTEEEEREWLFFVQTLLSVAGLDGVVQSSSLFGRWHSPGSPLDLSLRDKHIDLNEKELMHEANRRQRRSTRKLVFDCVNAALIELTAYGLDTIPGAIIPCGAVHSKFSIDASSRLVDLVWARMKEWFPGKASCFSGDGWDSNCLVAEGMVRNEVVGKGLSEFMGLEIEILGKEIEGSLLEELVQEAVVELAGRL